MTSGPMIDYEALAQDAMRGVVRAVLQRVAKEGGLPGDHHFYVSFDTQAQGISMSKRLKEKYPSEMTIVLQHRFWDLIVTEDRFEVKLTFDSIPERLVVPFAAVKVFFDPSVRYGLQFEDPDSGHEAGAFGDLAGDEAKPTTTRSSGPRKPRAARKPRADKDQAGATVAPLPIQPAPRLVEDHGEKPHPLPKPEPAPAAASHADKPGEESEKTADDKPASPPGAQIVSLDAFRKK